MSPILTLLFSVLLQTCLGNIIVSRRSYDGRNKNPVDMELTVQLPKKNEAVFQLKRIDKYKRLPLTISENNKRSQVNSNMLPELQNYEHYRDINNRAVFTLKRNGSVSNDSKRDSSYSFQGVFQHKREMYSVKPDLSNEGNHMVKRQPEMNLLDVENEDQMMEEDKRQHNTAGTKYTVELRMMLDHTVYNFFKKRTNNEAETLAELQTYYAYQLNAMDVVYRNIKDYSISVEAIDVYVAKNSYDAPWMRGVRNAHASTILDNVAKWGRNSDIKADHFMAFTKLDLTNDDGSSSVVGLAYMEGICGKTAASINEDNGLNMWSTSAHELGHNLGADHDDYTNCRGQRKVMSAIDTEYSRMNLRDAYHFSTCSINAMKKNIDKLGADNCLLKDNGIREMKYSKNFMPGQRWSPDQICKLFNPDSSGIYRDSSMPEDSICHSLWCKSKDGGTAISMKQAPIGMACGNKKICTFNGRCEVGSTNANVPEPGVWESTTSGPSITTTPEPRNTYRPIRTTTPSWNTFEPVNPTTPSWVDKEDEFCFNENEDSKCRDNRIILESGGSLMKDEICDYVNLFCCNSVKKYCTYSPPSSDNCVDGKSSLDRRVCAMKRENIVAFLNSPTLLKFYCERLQSYNCCKTIKDYCSGSSTTTTTSASCVDGKSKMDKEMCKLKKDSLKLYKEEGWTDLTGMTCDNLDMFNCCRTKQEYC